MDEFDLATKRGERRRTTEPAAVAAATTDGAIAW